MPFLKMFALLLFVPLAAQAQEGGDQVKVTPVMAKSLADYPNKEAVVLEVVYPPGGGDPVHKHNAHGFIYVLEGQIVMGVRGSKPVTLSRGETFYEGPNNVHTVGRNASLKEPAKFLVFLLKNKNEPILTLIH